MDRSHADLGFPATPTLRARLATCLRKAEIMGRGIYWNTKPEDTVKAAKARAKAALNEQNPKLTKLELAFYIALKNEIHLNQP